MKVMEDHEKDTLLEVVENFPEDLDDTSDLPTSLIITNVDITIFTEEEQRDVFEAVFKQFEEDATFQYFRSFRRARINFQNPDSAAKARIQCDAMKFGEDTLNCYFAQPVSPSRDDDSNDGFLQPPTPEKQFLISPPASPPVGWEPVHEAEPVVNYDLITALASLAPNEVHELHPQSDSTPGIVVHVCEDQRPQTGKTLKIIQTPRPGTEHLQS